MLFSAFSAVAGTVAYSLSEYNSPYGHAGGSLAGLAFGIIAALMMVFAGLLAVRKWLRTMRLGNARVWLRGHLWLGTLSILFVCFHAGFEWGGLLEQLLWGTLATVAVTGFFGLGIQQFLPRLMWTRTPLETIDSQIPYLCERMTVMADLQIAKQCEAALSVEDGTFHQCFSELVNDYAAIVQGDESRSEKNDRKLSLFQQVSSQGTRDFLWDMAGHAKNDMKAIKFEGDFPELLQKTYAGLSTTSILKLGRKSHPEQAGSPTITGPVGERSSRLDLLKKPADNVENANKPAMTSPLDQLRSAAAGDAVQKANKSKKAGSSLDQIRKKSPAKTSAASPLDQMRKQGAKKDQTDLPDQPSPLDQIRSPVHNKNADADSQVQSGQKARSPLDQIRQETSAAAEPDSAPAASPLDQLRKQAGRKTAEKQSVKQSSAVDQIRNKTKGKTAAAGTAPQSLKKTSSALDQIRDKATDSGLTTSAGKSPLDQIKAKATKPKQEVASSTEETTPTTLEKVKSKKSAGTASLLDKIKENQAGKSSSELGKLKSPQTVPSKKKRTEKRPSGTARSPRGNETERLGASRAEKDLLRTFYLELVRPFLAETRSTSAVRRSPFASSEIANRQFLRRKTILPAVLHPVLDELADCCERRRQFELQRKIHRWLHWWLMIHVPVSVGLLVLLVAHVVMALRVIPIRF